MKRMAPDHRKQVAHKIAERLWKDMTCCYGWWNRDQIALAVMKLLKKKREQSKKENTRPRKPRASKQAKRKAPPPPPED